MKVIGLTDELRGAAVEQCRGGFNAWLMEAQRHTWGNWEELKKHYPNVCVAENDETHFPLRADGFGVRANVYFDVQLLILLRIAPAPVVQRRPVRQPISLTPN